MAVDLTKYNREGIVNWLVYIALRPARTCKRGEGFDLSEWCMYVRVVHWTAVTHTS